MDGLFGIARAIHHLAEAVEGNCWWLAFPGLTLGIRSPHQGVQGRSDLKTNGKNGLGGVEELLRMTAIQTAENAKQLQAYSKEWREEMRQMRSEHNREMRQMRSEHNREMKEIRTLFRKMIERIAI